MQKHVRHHVSLHLRSATGREVFDWILDQGYYSERDTSNVVRQVLEAVAYLHSLQIVHRNLKVTRTASLRRSAPKKKKVSKTQTIHLECRVCKEFDSMPQQNPKLSQKMPKYFHQNVTARLIQPSKLHPQLLSATH